MCGRFTLYSSLSNLKKSFDIDTVTCEIKPSYNIAPGHEVYVITYPHKNIKDIDGIHVIGTKGIKVKL